VKTEKFSLREMGGATEGLADFACSGRAEDSLALPARVDEA